MRTILRFTALILAAQACLCAGWVDNCEDWLCSAYEVAADIRCFRGDDAWKAPCNAFRGAFQHRCLDGLAPVIAAGWAMAWQTAAMITRGA